MEPDRASTVEWRWLDLGSVDGPTMVNVFVSLAGPVGRRESLPTVVVLHPAAPFANVGYHQEADREIDLEYCRGAGIPVVRRVVGGGAILDGPWEQDYMVIVPNGTAGTEAGVGPFYDRFLGPVQRTLARLGVRAERSGVNDLAVAGRKVSANGALSLDGSWVLVGDILRELDVAAMTRVLRVPDEKFRGKLAKGMDEWLTSLTALLGSAPSRTAITRALREEYEREFGVSLVPGSLTEAEVGTLTRLRAERSSDAWTFLKESSHPGFRSPDLPPPGRSVKIAHDTYLGRSDRKAGKLVRVTLRSRGGAVEEIEISGDFFTQPFAGHLDELEASLVGCRLERGPLEGAIARWAADRKVALLGISGSDLVGAILDAGPPAAGNPAPP